MPTNTLTDARCKAIKGNGKQQKHFDGGGLHMVVTPAGAKVWRLAYRYEGKPKTMSFGPYPAVTLAEARQQREDAQAMLRAGADPMGARKVVKSDLLLEEAVDTYWAGRKDVTDAYRGNALACMDTHIYPDLKGRTLRSLTRADLMVPLNRMNDQGLFDYVRKARMWLDQVFDWGMEQGQCDGNPAKLIIPRKAFGAKKVEHFAAVEVHEVSQLMCRLNMEDPHLQSVLACKFLAYTWVRTVECRMMGAEEVIDDGATCLIKAGKMKRPRDHLIPLPRQAQEIVAQMLKRNRGSRFVWPGDRSIDRPMSENAILALLARIGYKGEMTGHGWRSIGSTWANERGYNPDAIEMQLAHVSDNKTRSAYNRARYLDERRRMLQDWADWLDAQTEQT